MTEEARPGRVGGAPPRLRTATADYAGAVAHYTSPRRRDAVKRRWEEPVSHRLLGQVLDRIDLDPAAPLHVVDVGCGTGNGLALLDATDRVRRRPGRLHYTGLDLDPQLLEVARTQHADDPRARFVRGDVRDPTAVGDADLVLSTGVPFSHLTRAELADALAGVFDPLRSRARPAAVVVDVLGRYSIEWTTRWERPRWAYRMSFFEGEDAPPSAEMSVYGGQELAALVRLAATRARCAVAEVAAVDRSVLVGRHSTTGEYTPGLAPFRALVNDLWEATAEVDLDRLRLDVPLPPAPAPVHAFYAEFAAAWNARVEAARADGGHPARVRRRLAGRLRELEVRRQRGLGVGHSLTVVAITAPQR